MGQCFNYFIKSVRIQLEIAVYFSTSCFNLFMIFNFNTNRPFVLFLSCFIILTLSTKWIVPKNYVYTYLDYWQNIYKLNVITCIMYSDLHDSHTMYVWNVHLIEIISEDCMQWKCKHTLDNFAGYFLFCIFSTKFI